MEPIIPPKLQPGDLVRVVTPACSRAMVMEHDHSALIEERFAGWGLRLSYGQHVDERDRFDSSTVEHRVADLHAAFADPDVKMISTVIGGFSSNELLPHLDWDLVRANPKILCGYSDITALQHAIFSQTGLVTYSGPHWSTFGMRDHLDETIASFEACLLRDEPVAVTPALTWTDDAWFLDQDARDVHDNAGWWTLQTGSAEGVTLGGNLGTLGLLQGTPWMPDLAGALLVLEDDLETNPVNFRRDLTSLLQQPGADAVVGLVIGRFQRTSGITREHVEELVAAQPALAGKPVLANVDVGHTNPMITWPVGGRAMLDVQDEVSGFVITEH